MTRALHFLLAALVPVTLLVACTASSVDRASTLSHDTVARTTEAPSAPRSAAPAPIAAPTALAVGERMADSNTQASLAGMEVRLSSFESGNRPHDAIVSGDPSGTTIPAPEQAPSARSSTIGTLASKAEAKNVAEHYLRSVQSGAYETAWGMLTQETQSAWVNQDLFTQFYRGKFGLNPIVTFALGTASDTEEWIDPSSGATLDGVVSAPLTIIAKNGSTTVRIGGPAIRLRSMPGGWRIARLGAAGPEGTIVAPRELPARSLHVPILMYHHIGPTPVRSQYRTEYDYRLAYDLTVSPEAFAGQLAFLEANGYQPVTTHAILNYLFYGIPLPAKPVALTFDDGYLDNFTYALSALQSRHMIATFNVITGLVGQRGKDLQYMSWDDLKGIVHQGMDVQSHTVTHHDLGTLSNDAALLEMVQSRAALQDHLNVAADVLTYPSGEPFRSGSIARQRDMLKLLPRAGYTGALLDQRTNATMQHAWEPFQLARVRVAGGESLKVFGENLGPSGP